MARSVSSSRRRLGIGVAGVVLAAAAAGCTTPFVSGGGGSAPASEMVVICESGVVDHGNGVETSSQVAIKLPAGSPVPEGCRVA